MVKAYGGEFRCLERLLVSRQGDVGKAAEAFSDTLSFRKEHGLDDGTFVLDEEMRQRVQRYWPGVYSAETSVSGAPLQLFRPGILDTSALLANCTEAEIQAYHIAWLERSLALQRESNASRGYGKGAAWQGMLEVYDWTGLSPSHLAPTGLTMLSRVLSIGQRHYPENLQQLFIINAPMISTAAWKVISAGLPSSTNAKIRILRDGTDELVAALGDAERLAAFMALLPPAQSWSSWLGMS